jgi:hypothetical protein
MARYSIEGSILDNIANAINEKTGETAAMVPSKMAEKILSIEGGNSNYVETIEGTLANPFGSIDAFVLANEIADGNATATLTFEAENETWVLRVCYETLDTAADDEAIIPFFYVQYPMSIRFASTITYARVSYDVYSNDDTEFADEPVVRLQSATAETDVDSDTACTLTVIHHPISRITPS